MNIEDKRTADVLYGLPNTTAGRRIRRLATTRYAWVSKDVPADLYELAQRFPGVANSILRNTRGATRNLGRNALKRTCDAVSFNDKDRTRLRSYHTRAMAARLAASN